MEPRLLNLLLVEDDQDHASLAMRALEENRIANSVHRVSSGEDALAYLRGESGYSSPPPLPDIILLDLHLPGMSGHEVLKALKSDERYRGIPVVILTISEADSDRAKAYELHANSYIVKPLDFDKYQDLIRSLGFYWGMLNRPVALEENAV